MSKFAAGADDAAIKMLIVRATPMKNVGDMPSNRKHSSRYSVSRIPNDLFKAKGAFRIPAFCITTSLAVPVIILGHSCWGGREKTSLNKKEKIRSETGV